MIGLRCCDCVIGMWRLDAFLSRYHAKYNCHVILSEPIHAFVSDYKWISLAFERGWVTKYVGGITGFILDYITTIYRMFAQIATEVKGVKSGC